MKNLCIFLLSLLSVQGKDTRIGKGVKREVGTPYGAELSLPSGDAGPRHVAGGGAHHDHLSGTVDGNYLVRDGDGSLLDRPAVAPHVTTGDDPVGIQAIRNYAKGANAAIETYGPGSIPKITEATGAVNIGGVRVQGATAGHLSGHAVNPGPFGGPSGSLSGPIGGPEPYGVSGPHGGSLGASGPGTIAGTNGPSGPHGGHIGTHGGALGASGPGTIAGSNGPFGPHIGTHGSVTGPGNGLVPPAGAAGPDFNFNAAIHNVNNMPFGNSARFISEQAGFVGDRAPSVFNYQSAFNGNKDYNHLPHILPPGGKTIEQLQAESDEKLRVIMARALERQKSALNRIDSLKSQYGVGTIGFNGWADKRFEIPGNIDLGTHKGLDLGTSIDASQYMTADGKLKLPVQNVYHKKTVGVKIPQPYPVKEEVLVPKPYPVNHYIKVPVPVPVHTTTEAPAPQITIKQQAPQTIYGQPLSQTISLEQPSIQTEFQPPPPPPFELNTALSPPSLMSKFTSQVTSNQVDDSSEESNEVTGSRYSSQTFSIEPSRSVSESSSLGLFPSAKPPAFQTSYGPPASGPVHSGFLGNAALASFPPFDFSQFSLMMMSPGKAYPSIG